MATITETNEISMSYSSKVYNTVIISLLQATEKFAARNAQPIINAVIRDCFIRNHVESQFSACLIHRYFDIGPGERNVESDGKAVASKDVAAFYPSSWMFYEGKCYPCEYKRYAVLQPPNEFVEDFGKVLEKEGFCDLIGFQIYTDGVIGLEGTVDNVSTTVEQDENLPIPPGMAPASWAFFSV